MFRCAPVQVARPILTFEKGEHMIRRIAFGLVLAVIVLILGLTLTTPSISAQAGRGVTTVKLASGVIVEEVILSGGDLHKAARKNRREILVSRGV